jgi:hypothetical protein
MSKRAWIAIFLLGAGATVAWSADQVFPVTSGEAALWTKDPAGKNELAYHACKVFEANCYRCHGGKDPNAANARDKIDNILDYKALVKTKYLTAGDLDSSVLRLIQIGAMPYDGRGMVDAESGVTSRSDDHGKNAKLSQTDIIGIWLLAGTPEWQTQNGLAGLGAPYACKAP